jgi:PAS domain S-box-containing protein
MLGKDSPIQQKMMAVILLVTGFCLVLSCVGFTSYEFFTLHKNMARALDTRADVIANDAGMTLVNKNPAEATEVLGVFQKDPRMLSACIYDADGRIFARYPATAPDAAFPAKPGDVGDFFGPSSLSTFYPIIRNGRALGTVYLKSNLSALTDRYHGYAELVLIILAGSLLVAYLLSRVLQKQISQPIQSLAETARLVSEKADYSIRAAKYGKDELGLLTDTFNQMLARIEAQRQILSQFAAIVESSDDAIISNNLDGVITSWNPGAEKLFGYSASEALGQKLLSLLPADRAGEELKILAQIAQGEVPANFETVRVRKNGTPVDIAVSISPIKDGNGKVISISKIARDITARKQAEAEILQLNDHLERRVQERTAELEAANKELEAFSYSVSHDLRAPLRAMDGFSQAIEEDYGAQLPEDGKRYLRTVRENAQRMGALIDDLLAFSRLSRKPLSLHPVNSDKLLREILAELNGRRKDRQIDIKIGQLPACQGDESLLKQVWANLLSNAVKYTGKQDAATIEVGCERINGDEVYYVRDNGIGFDMQYAHKLFGVFQRLHRADEFEGTGVGLAIAQRIVHRHGGRIWADSALNQGADFYFTLGKKTTL